MDTSSIQHTVRDYIVRELLGGELEGELTQFGVEFEAHEVGPEFLDSVETIVATVAGKLGG